MAHWLWVMVESGWVQSNIAIFSLALVQADTYMYMYIVELHDLLVEKSQYY